MQLLTQEQKDQLLQAIAQAGGSGMYVDPDTDTPLCVVGCLARNLGVPINVLKDWDAGRNGGCSISALAWQHKNKTPVPQLEIVLPFDIQLTVIPQPILELLGGRVDGLLQVIQAAWDAKGTEATRQHLKNWIESLPVRN
jgi:hypothetical protein